MGKNKIKQLLNFIDENECDKILSGNYNQEILNTKIYEEIQKHFPIKFKGYIPSGFIDIKLNEYQVDQKYHDFKSNDDNYISFMIQLNNDYNEGYFQFLINDGESYFQVNHGAGHLVLFFSNLKQRTTPVKSGIKKTLSGKILLIKDKDVKNTLI
jgi:predicted 2-oxoglutarate/Fe(II)-dependent dioxygenase YbiX